MAVCIGGKLGLFENRINVQSAMFKVAFSIKGFADAAMLTMLKFFK
jgi:hypothetical protein